MPTLKLEQRMMRLIQARHGVEHDPSRLAEELPLLGTDIDRCDDEMLEIEIFPDRPDLLSGETLSHATRPFLYGSTAESSFHVGSSSFSMSVDPELGSIRPVILGAVVKGVDTGEGRDDKEDFIKSLMDHQEKLHFALGRGRRRASIGVHDMSSLKPPFRVVSVSEDFSFIPLQRDSKMSIREILDSHEKGMEYAHLLDGMDGYPVILDADDAVLSFPPIINGDHTTVHHGTTDFFIDVTGWDERACHCSLLLICLQLVARGGRVDAVEVKTFDGRTIHTPDSNPIVHRTPTSLVSNILGHGFSDEELNLAMNRMGGAFRGRDTSSGQEELLLEMPGWRFDILHPVDLVEEIAIGHGYENLGEASPNHASTATPVVDSGYRRRIRQSLQGMGLQQVQSLTLSNEGDQFTSMRLEPCGEVTSLSNPITTEHTIMRQSILPSLLRLLAANRHNELPQRVYESGVCVRQHRNMERFAWLCAENVSSFAECRGMVQALLRDMGHSGEVDWIPTPSNEGPWLAGRGCSVNISGIEIGRMGEIDPVVGDGFDLRVPLHAAEFDLEALMKAIPDPVL